MWLSWMGFDAPRTSRHKNQYGWHVHQEFTLTNVLSTCGLFIGTYSPKILPDLLVPGWNILWCQYGYCDMCPYIIYNSDHCGSGKSVCTIVSRLCWKPLGRGPMAWLVQSIITLWILGGCYRRYVDKISSNTILLLSSIPCHWIGTMGRCQFLVSRLEIFTLEWFLVCCLLIAYSWYQLLSKNRAVKCQCTNTINSKHET
jgi:hypothetical protein